MRRSNDLNPKRRRLYLSIIGVFGSISLISIFFSAPLTAYERLGGAIVFGCGLAVATVIPSLTPIGGRLVGLAVLSLVLLPSFGAEPYWMAISVLILGIAVANIAVFVRVVIALPIVLAAASFHAGDSISTTMLTMWSASTLIALIATNQYGLIRAGTTFTAGHSGAYVTSERSALRLNRWARPLAASLAIIIISPLAIGLGYSVDLSVPQFALRSNLGSSDGEQLTKHPGMTGSLDVGEPVDLSDDIVLRVESDQSHYWRATTYDVWDGRTWTASSPWQPFQWSGGGLQPLDQNLPVGVPTKNLRQVFRTEQAGLDVLLGAPSVDGFWTPSGSAQLLDDGSVLLDTPLGAQARWTTDSSVALVDEAILRGADANTTPVPSSILNRYASQPKIDPRVADLAVAITAGHTNIYDKVRALEAWMDQNITYDRNIAPLAPGEDAVSKLLFSSKTGFCEQIGSALVVMLRSVGVAARLAVGYVPGEYDSSRGEWLSRGSDAHAWAEVYFPGIGWQGFDPTASVPLAGGNNEVDLFAWKQAAVGTLITSTVAALVIGGWVGAGRAFLGRVSRSRKADLQRRFDRCGTLLGLCWSESTTLGERAVELSEAGLDNHEVAEAVGRLRQVYYGPEEQTDVAYIAVTEAILADLEKSTSQLVKG